MYILKKSLSRFNVKKVQKNDKIADPIKQEIQQGAGFSSSADKPVSSANKPLTNPVEVAKKKFNKFISLNLE